MSGARRNILILVVSLVVVSLGLFFGLRSTADSEPQVTEESPGVHFENVELVGNQGGVRQWQLSSKSLRQEGELVYLDELDHVIVYEANLPKYYVEADRGVWNPSQDRLTLNDNVIVDDQTGFWLSTNNLIWYSAEESFEFMGDTTVKFDRGGTVND